MEDHEELLAGGRTWLEHAKELLNKDGVSKTESISWAAYEASQCPALKFPNTTSFMLPLFTEPANSPISVHLGMRMAHVPQPGCTQVVGFASIPCVDRM